MIEDAAPKAVNIIEKPRTKKNEWVMVRSLIFLLLLRSCMSLNEIPVINVR